MKKLSLTKKSAMTGRLFCIPLYLGIIMFFLTPLIQSLSFSFQNVTPDIGGFHTDSVGFSNYLFAFRVDENFSSNLLSSLTSLLYQVPVILISSLFFAVILNQKFKGRVFVRAVFFLPVIVASGVVLQILKMDAVSSIMISGTSETQTTVFSSSALQGFLIESGLSKEMVNYFTTISNNLFDLLWKTGIQMIMFLAGLQTIPSSLYEASSIEGATAWENFWMITFPMLLPVMLVNTVYTIVDYFTDPLNPIMNQILKQFEALEYGRAAAMAWVYFLVIAVILMAVFVIFSASQRDKPEKEAGRV